jgi:hypothetical protein
MCAKESCFIKAKDVPKRKQLLMAGAVLYRKEIK